MDSLWKAFLKSGAVGDYLRYRAHCGSENAGGRSINGSGINGQGINGRPAGPAAQ